MNNVRDLRFIDSHSHPHDKKYIEAGVDQDKMMRELQEAGGATIAIGTDYAEIEKAIHFSKKYENCWCTIGIHPADNHMEIFSEEKFESFLRDGLGKVVGVGECGLDYYYFPRIPNENEARSISFSEVELEKYSFDKNYIETQKVRQKELFISQIEFALKHDLPLVLHGRPSKNSMDAYRDMLDILETFPKVRGHAHFFVGNLEIAKRFLDLGFLMSFDGPITFTNEYDKVLEFLPLDKIMIETDSPYAAPMPYRGQLNFPMYVIEVAKKIANIKNIPFEEVLEITKNNAIKLFGLEKK